MFSIFHKKEKKSWRELLKEKYILLDDEIPLCVIFEYLFYHSIDDNIIRVKYRNLDK